MCIKSRQSTKHYIYISIAFTVSSSSIHFSVCSVLMLRYCGYNTKIICYEWWCDCDHVNQFIVCICIFFLSFSFLLNFLVLFAAIGYAVLHCWYLCVPRTVDVVSLLWFLNEHFVWFYGIHQFIAYEEFHECKNQKQI